MSNNSLLKQWRDVAYSQQADKAKLQKFWAEYFVIESIEGNSISGKISDILKDGGYGNEYFSGTINGSLIEINGIQRKNTNINFRWDLHFTGTISGNTISGKWDRIENGSENMVYVKM